MAGDAYQLKVRLVDQNGNPLVLTSSLSTDIPDRADRELGRVAISNGSAKRWQLVDIGAGDFTFAVPPLALYASADATVVLEDDAGTQATFQMFIGQNPYSPRKVVKAGTNAGVVLWGLY